KEWSIVKPQPIDADQGKITAFLQSLSTATIDQTIAAHPADLKDFGLDPPQETIQVETNSKPQQFTLLLGSETPTSNGVYAQVEGNPRVFTLTDSTKTALEKTLFDLRNTKAVTLDTGKLDRIEAKSGSQTYTLAKNPEGVWDVSLPPDVRADHFTVDGLVDNLQALTMQSIVSEKKGHDSKYGFGKPELTLKLVTPSAAQTLLVGKKASGGYYAMNSALAPVFTLDQDSVSQLQKSASDFRDKDLFSWNTFDVKSFDVTTSKGQQSFEQVKNEWKETAPAAKQASSDKVQAFLSALRDLRVTSFPPAKPGELAKFGLAKPMYSFKVQFGSKNQSETVEVGQAGGHVYARRASDPLPGEVSQSDLKSIEDALGKL
ncbi:MAG TPA: DUF4340 domain-containing protein, partial [Terriglobia bacterium]|nr:DUF4340 domain-containing protein [Terriglobia bacterium]